MPDNFTVTLDVRDRGTVLSAICKDVPGLHVYGSTAEDVRQRAMRAVVDLYRRNKGLEVSVFPTDDLNVLRVKLS